jgi:hypothetical protein
LFDIISSCKINSINNDEHIHLFYISDELARFEDAWKGNNLGTLPDYDTLGKKGKLVFCSI